MIKIPFDFITLCWHSISTPHAGVVSSTVSYSLAVPHAPIEAAAWEAHRVGEAAATLFSSRSYSELFTSYELGRTSWSVQTSCVNGTYFKREKASERRMHVPHTSIDTTFYELNQNRPCKQVLAGDTHEKREPKGKTMTCVPSFTGKKAESLSYGRPIHRAFRAGTRK